MRKFFHFFLILSLFFLFGCDPCRKIHKHPERYQPCFDARTEIKADSGGVKVANRDSSANKADSAVTGLVDTFFKYIEVYKDCNVSNEAKDSISKVLYREFSKVRQSVKETIKTAPCLSDTATFTDISGAVLKLWQEGKEIKYSLSYPHINYELKDAGLPWWVWLLIGYGLCILTFAGLIIRSKT